MWMVEGLVEDLVEDLAAAYPAPMYYASEAIDARFGLSLA